MDYINIQCQYIYSVSIVTNNMQGLVIDKRSTLFHGGNLQMTFENILMQINCCGL